MVQLAIVRSVHCNKNVKIWYTTRLQGHWIHTCTYNNLKGQGNIIKVKIATKYTYIGNNHSTEVHTY